MIRTKQKATAILLAFLMALTVFAGMGTVVADAATAPAEKWDGSVDVSWYNTTATEFHISTPAQLAGLAAMVNGVVLNGKENPDATKIKDAGAPSAVATGKSRGSEDFKGKTIYLDADLDMGGVNSNGTWSGPVWAPIGGQWITLDEAVKVDASFNGVLNGQGHRIQNIYCDMQTGQDSQSIGLVGRLGCHDKDAADLQPTSPGVKNLAVTGYIKGGRSVGGIVGKIGKTADSGAVIENCVNSAEVTSTQKKGVGGICGSAWNKGTIKNCYNTGKVNAASKFENGGIAGSNESALINCYNAGTITSASGTSAAIATQTSGSYENCHWLKESAGTGVYNITSDQVCEQDADTMKSAEFVDTLNGSGSAYVQDTENSNGGYPILKWQKETDITADIWDGAVDTSWYNTSAKTFTLSKPAQLAGLAAIVNGTAAGVAQDDFAGKTVTLAGNIKLDTANDKYSKATGTFGAAAYAMTAEYYTVKADANIWTPIGTAKASGNSSLSDQNYFCGTFNGNGKTISGLYTKGTDTVQGLFGCLGEGAAVKNLTMQGCVTAKIVAGGIAAYVKGAAISNCTNEAIVYADAGQVADSGTENGIKYGGAIGGIAGSAEGTAEHPLTIENCTNLAAVVCTNTNKGGRAGGILGLVDQSAATGSISKCVNNGTIDAYQYSGGIIGMNNSTAMPIDNCVNTKTVSVHSSGTLYCGGIAALTKSDINNCYNTGNFRASIDGTGGNKASTLAGIAGSFSGTKIENCYNTGSLVLDGNAGTSSSTGAICGSGYGTASANKLINCYYLTDTAYSNTDVATEVAEADFKTKEMAEKLGTAYAVDTEKTNNGYPVLSWQISDDTKAAAVVTEKIAAIGKVTLSSEKTIKEARSAYNALSPEAKKLVKNLSTLTAAEKSLTQQKKAANTPAAIKNIKAASSSYNSAKITWNKDTKAKAYVVYRASSKTGTYKEVKRTTARIYTDKGLSTGKTYYYRVRAYGMLDGTKLYGSYSSKTAVKPIPATGKLKAKAGKRSATLSWTKVAGADKYQLYRATDKTGKYYKMRETTKLRYKNTGLKKRTYYYKVRAYKNVKGKKVYSKYSSVIKVKVK